MRNCLPVVLCYTQVAARDRSESADRLPWVEATFAALLPWMASATVTEVICVYFSNKLYPTVWLAQHGYRASARIRAGTVGSAPCLRLFLEAEPLRLKLSHSAWFLSCVSLHRTGSSRQAGGQTVKQARPSRQCIPTHTPLQLARLPASPQQQMRLRVPLNQSIPPYCTTSWSQAGTGHSSSNSSSLHQRTSHVPDFGISRLLMATSACCLRSPPCKSTSCHAERAGSARRYA